MGLKVGPVTEMGLNFLFLRSAHEVMNILKPVIEVQISELFFCLRRRLNTNYIFTF